MKSKFEIETCRKIYVVNSNEIKKRHIEEKEEITINHANSGTIRSGNYIQELISKYSQQLHELAEVKLNSYSEYFGAKILISKVDKEKIVNDFNTFFDIESRKQVRATQGLLYSTGLTTGGMFDGWISMVNENVISIRSLYMYKLDVMIDKNNSQAKGYLAQNGFWAKNSDKIKIIIALIGIILTIITILLKYYKLI